MNQLSTEWLEEDPLWDQVYPRPQMVREKWQSLNGLWDIREGGTCLVPFCAESMISGAVVRTRGFYTLERRLTLDEELDQDIILLHFDAVDQAADIYCNSAGTIL